MAAATMVPSPVTTPRDYHRIVSPTLTIPTDVTQPIPVGLLSRQRQPRCPDFFPQSLGTGLLCRTDL